MGREGMGMSLTMTRRPVLIRNSVKFASASLAARACLVRSSNWAAHPCLKDDKRAQLCGQGDLHGHPLRNCGACAASRRMLLDMS